MQLKRQKDQVNHCGKRLRVGFNKKEAARYLKVDQMVKIYISATQIKRNTSTFNAFKSKN